VAGKGHGGEDLRALNYEGLPPEVGAFKFQKWVHAPWAVHNFGIFWHFCDVFRIRGVGVIPRVWHGFGWLVRGQ